MTATPLDFAPRRTLGDSARSLRWRIVVSVGAGALLLLALLVWIGSQAVDRFVATQADTRLLEAAHRSVLLVDQALVERQRQAELIAQTPTVVDAARHGGQVAARMGLVGRPTDELERRFDAERSLDAAPEARRFLRSLLGTLGIAEIMVTDANGFNAVTTEKTSDFVQSDEMWWQRAWRDGATPADATYDESAHQTVVSISNTVEDPLSERPLGVVKVSFGMKTIDAALTRGSVTGGLEVDLIDAAGQVIASSEEGARGKVMAGYDQLEQAGHDSIVSYTANGAAQRAATLYSNAGQWRLVAHLDQRQAFAEARHARSALMTTALLLLVFIIWALYSVSSFIARRISQPAAELAEVAEAVAGGDLSIELEESEEADEIGRLNRATVSMIRELRRLALAMKTSSEETAAMSAEITAGSEEMAASAHQMAETSGDLSQQATQMATTIQDLAGDAGQLVAIAAELDAGAHEGVERNAALRALAQENRVRLDESARALASLGGDVEATNVAIDTLAAASEEIRSFVILVRKVARQSKLLALNAAMEAARAGEHGEGFAVVASEVRRLAASAADAAERTETLVADVLARIDETRSSSARTFATVRAVTDTTQHSFESFGEIERAVNDAESWTTAIEQAAATSNDLVNKMTHRMEGLARGTEAFAAAMEEVAAASEEQSASTQQIAAAAATLAGAADSLAKLVGTFRLDAGAPEAPPSPDAPASDVPVPDAAAVPAAAFGD